MARRGKIPGAEPEDNPLEHLRVVLLPLAGREIEACLRMAVPAGPKGWRARNIKLKAATGVFNIVIGLQDAALRQEATSRIKELAEEVRRELDIAARTPERVLAAIEDRREDA